MRLIQGVFFQNNQGLCVGYGGDGASVFVVEALCQTMFAGFIVNDPQNAVGGLMGAMHDRFGISRLSNVRCNEYELSFDKTYEGRGDVIHYKFPVNVGPEWFGTYEGRECGKGVCRCVVTEVPDDFQDPRRVVEKLGATTAHKWPE